MIVLTLPIVTAYGQSTTPCNYPNVCYTVNQDKRCLECFEINKGLNKLVDQQVQLMEASFYENEGLVIENEKLTKDSEKKDIKIKKKNKTIWGFVGTTILTTFIAIIK